MHTSKVVVAKCYRWTSFVEVVRPTLNPYDLMDEVYLGAS